MLISQNCVQVNCTALWSYVQNVTENAARLHYPLLNPMEGKITSSIFRTRKTWFCPLEQLVCFHIMDTMNLITDSLCIDSSKMRVKVSVLTLSQKKSRPELTLPIVLYYTLTLISFLPGFIFYPVIHICEAKWSTVNINAHEFSFVFIHYLSSKLGKKVITNRTKLHQVTENWGKIFTNIQNNALLKIKTNFLFVCLFAF